MCDDCASFLRPAAHISKEETKVEKAIKAVKKVVKKKK